MDIKLVQLQLSEEELHFKKVTVLIGLILLILGAAIFIFPAQESYQNTVTETEWPLQQVILEPQNSTFWGWGPMIYRVHSIQLNIDSLDSSGYPATVIVTISTTQQEGTSKIVFQDSQSSFHQLIPISLGGTYFVDIKNANSFSVTLEGSIDVQKTEEGNRTVYPHALPGFLIMLGGACVLIFGVFKKPKKTFKPKGASKS